MRVARYCFRFICVLLFIACASVNLHAQSYDIKSYNGVYSYTSTEVPEYLVSVLGTVQGGFQWEQSYEPTGNFSEIPGEVSSFLSFSTPLTRTTYFRRKITRPNYVDYSNLVKLELVLPNWENYNYVREHDVLIAGVDGGVTSSDDFATVIAQLPIGSKFQTTTYLDGLGRTVEKISRETATPSNPSDPTSLWGDVVQFAKYDGSARQPKQYLPYTTTNHTGKFKVTAIADQGQYYFNTYSETSAFSSITFDNSPLNRVMNVKQPGLSWANSPGSSGYYELNDAAEDVRIFSVGYTPGEAPVSTGTYPANSLYKQRSVDENGKAVVEYVNKMGQLVLKKVQLDDNPSLTYAGWICTYSVFDDFGLLRYQIPPEAVKWLDTNGWSFNSTNGQTLLDEMCFRYEYDEKGRMILKKSPGAEPLYMLYDKRDRVVFMQDGNQRAKSPAEWTVNLYDALDRPVITTLYHTAKSIAELQNDIDHAYTSSTVTISNPSSLVTDLVVDHRDGSIGLYEAQNSIEFVPGFESISNDEFTASINPNAITTPIDITTVTYLNPITQSELNDASVTTVLKYLFYDYYDYSTVKPFNTSFDNGLAYSTGGDPIEKTQRTWSMSTGSMVRVLGTNTFLTSTIYYDERGRAIQSTEENIKSGTDVTTIQYKFDNRVLSTNTKHTANGTGYTNYSIVTKNIFDRIGRIISIEKKYGSNDFKPIAEYNYDDIGRLKSKRLDPGYTGTGRTEIETLAYSYNIHNQLIGINKDYALKTQGIYSKWSNFFGLYLGYDNRDGVFDIDQLDGHITGALWNTQGDDVQRKYDYTYDNAGRLSKAIFKEKKMPSDTWSSSTMDFSVTGYNGKIEYDLNGNLLAMLQKGVVPGNNTPQTVDDMRYVYASLSNKLVKVTDMGTLGTNNGKLGDFKDGTNSADDYVYDANGNLLVDLNKLAIAATNGPATPLGTAGVIYNYLDKPEEIHIAGKGTIKIVYDASGNKLQRSYTEDGTTNTVVTTYINQFVYHGNELQYINFEEGRIRVMQAVSQDNGFDFLNIDGNMDLPNDKRGAYDFYIRDYLGSVRMILTEEAHIGSNTCTMESQRANNEEPIFGQVDNNGVPTSANEVRGRFSVANIPGQSTNNGWSNNNIGSYVSRVGNLASSKLGPNTLLKVMAGDNITATTMYYYKNPVVNTNSGNTLLNSVITSLVNAISGSGAASGSVKSSATAIGDNLNVSIPFNEATSPDASNTSGDFPKAYLTVLFFDERFNFVEESSSAVRVHEPDYSNASLALPNLKAPKNGYVYIYVSNESDEHVYFDNVQVTHDHGRIIEENHYYAYGLKIAAISSRKLGDINEGHLKNNHQYQGDFSEMDDDINWSDFELRNYDPQIGRWVQQDPFGEFATPYIGMGGDPVNNIDPNGGNAISAAVGGTALLLAATTTVGAMIGGVVGAKDGGVKGMITGAIIGAAAGLLSQLDGVGLAIGRAVIGVGDILTSVVNAKEQSQQPSQQATNTTSNDKQYVNNNGDDDGQLRSDGSRMFKNQNAAYKWMVKRSLAKNYREVFAVILKTSVLVLPDSKNTQGDGTPEKYGYKWEKGNLVDPVSGATLTVIATIHTHLAPWGDPAPSITGDGDLPYFAKNTPNKPYLTIGNDGFVYGNYGSQPLNADGTYHNSDIKTTQIAFDRGGVIRVTNGAIMHKFALREYLQYYMRIIAKIFIP